MKNNINFMLPKIAGMTLLAGVGAMVLFLLFKLLMVALVVSVVVVAVKSAKMLFHQTQERIGNYDDEFGGRLDYNNYNRQTSLLHTEKILPLFRLDNE
ncbi:MAG: hypothetical protein IPN87_06470 [Saprospiraceae bacterium]|nr:hypothetical protein [Candidatus Brachybacter algidus]